MNILVVIVMAVIWMVGGIVKAMKSKSGSEQQPSRGPTRNLPAHGRGVREQKVSVRALRAQRPAGPAQPPTQPSGVPEKRTTLADLRAAARKFAAEAEQAFQMHTAKPAPRPAIPTLKPQVRPEMAPIIESVVPPIKGLADKQVAPAQMPPTQRLSDLRSDYADPDKLRKAILHYEILGPPLSVRD